MDSNIWDQMKMEWAQRSDARAVPERWGTDERLAGLTPAAIVELAHGQGDRGRTDGLLAGLVRLAATDELAARTVVQVMLPGMRCLARRTASPSESSEDRDATVIEGLWRRVRTYPWWCQRPVPGTGKSHVLVALGHAAVDAGYKVRYFVAAELVESLYRGLADNSVGRVIESILRADLVICDEVGFAPLDDTGAQLLFRFVAAAYERRPLAIASHWPFEKAHTFPPTYARWRLILIPSQRRRALLGRHCRPCSGEPRPRSTRTQWLATEDRPGERRAPAGSGGELAG